MSSPELHQTTTDEKYLIDYIHSALFHFWNCDGGCGMLHSAMAELARASCYKGAYPEQAAEIAAYEGRRINMTMEIDDDQP